jgi:hypothetical protein
MWSRWIGSSAATPTCPTWSLSLLPELRSCMASSSRAEPGGLGLARGASTPSYGSAETHSGSLSIRPRQLKPSSRRTGMKSSTAARIRFGRSWFSAGGLEEQLPRQPGLGRMKLHRPPRRPSGRPAGVRLSPRLGRTTHHPRHVVAWCSRRGSVCEILHK